jgi:hypothetical protein
MFRQTFKRIIARIGVAVVLFTQLAVAAYACPAVEGPAAVIAAASVEAMRTAMPGCEMNDGAATPNLCLQHCQAGDQSVQTLPQVAVPAFAAVSLVVVFEPVLAEAGRGNARLPASPTHAVSPPPLIRFGVLRI